MKKNKCNEKMPVSVPLRFRPDTSTCLLDKGHGDMNHMSALSGDNWNLVFYWREWYNFLEWLVVNSIPPIVADTMVGGYNNYRSHLEVSENSLKVRPQNTSPCGFRFYNFHSLFSHREFILTGVVDTYRTSDRLAYGAFLNRTYAFRR